MVSFNNTIWVSLETTHMANDTAGLPSDKKNIGDKQIRDDHLIPGGGGELYLSYS